MAFRDPPRGARAVAVGGVHWVGGVTPEVVFERWQPRATRAVIRRFARHLRRSWYGRINRRSGFSGRVWAANLSPAGWVLLGANYVPYIESNETTGEQALLDEWSEFDANGAVRGERVKP